MPDICHFEKPAASLKGKLPEILAAILNGNKDFNLNAQAIIWA
jgi:hypothetical protein